MTVNIDVASHSTPECETEEIIMKDTLITITGLNYRFGSEFLKKGMKVKLVKEPDNVHDKEAIRVDFKGLGTIYADF